MRVFIIIILLPPIMKPTKKELKQLTSLLLKIGVLEEKEEKFLIRQFHNGEHEALALLLERNIRFVQYVAKNYENKGVELPDLIAAGTKGLVQAAQNFDESQDVRFFSYAIWWIRHYIIEEIEKIK